MFTVEHNGHKINQTFPTRREAEEWAEWNYKDKNGWRVLPDILTALEEADANPNQVESWRDLVAEAAVEIRQLRAKG